MANSILDVSKILNDYSIDVQETITADAQNVAKQGVNDLKRTSPERTGKYRKGWRVKTIKGNGFVDCTIHNATSYQLTHLLEKPHLTRNGKIVMPKVHILPVELRCKYQFEKDVETIIKNGG